MQIETRKEWIIKFVNITEAAQEKNNIKEKIKYGKL